MINKFFTKFNTSLNITRQSKITRVANELTLRECESTLRDVHARVSTAGDVRCALVQLNARTLLPRFLSILNSDWLKHARSVRGVYE